jgi:hypothetical protein
LAVQALQKLCQQHPKQAQNQLLQAPNGLHRLGDLLQTGQDEQVRNEALLLAGYLAKWPAIAKVWMFSEVGDVVIQLAVEEGGLEQHGGVRLPRCYKYAAYDAAGGSLSTDNGAAVGAFVDGGEHQFLNSRQ